MYIKMSHLGENKGPNARDILYENRYILPISNKIVEIGAMARSGEVAGIYSIRKFPVDFYRQIILHNLFYRQTTAGV